MLISEQPTWNPIQCWVWIRFRTNEALNVLGPGTAYASYVTYEHEENSSANDTSFEEICPNATEELSTKLIKGLITATGTDPDTNRTVEINRNWWRNATLSRLRPGETQFGTPKYGNILLDVSEIVKHWPPNTIDLDKNGGPKTPEEQEARKQAVEFIEYIARDNPENPFRIKDDFIAELIKKFPILSDREARKAWDLAAPLRWRRPGSRGGNKKSKNN